MRDQSPFKLSVQSLANFDGDFFRCHFEREREEGGTSPAIIREIDRIPQFLRLSYCEVTLRRRYHVSLIFVFFVGFSVSVS